MRILMVCPRIGKQNYGAEKLCLDLMAHFKNEGHVVGIAADFEKDSDLSIGDGVQMFSLKSYKNKILRKFLFDYLNIENNKKIKEIIKTFNPDLIHFHNIYGLGASIVEVASKIKPTLMTVHDYFPIDYQGLTNSNGLKSNIPILSELHKRLMYKFLKNTTLVAPSKFMQNKLIEGGFSNALQIYNGIRLDSNEKINNSKEKIKNILWVGNLRPEKGIQNICEPMHNFITENPDFTFTILGDGPLMDLKIKYPLFNWLGFQDPNKFYNNSGILIFSSIRLENQPYVVCEAMKNGICVIRNNLGSAKEMFIDGESGILYNSPDELIAKLTKIKEDYQLYHKISKGAIDFSNEHYDINQMYLNYDKLYQNLLI